MDGICCLMHRSSIADSVSSQIPETCIQACLCLLTVSASVSPSIVEEHMRTPGTCVQWELTVAVIGACLPAYPLFYSFYEIVLM